MGIKFMNSKNSKISNLHRPLLKLTDKLNITEIINMLLY